MRDDEKSKRLKCWKIAVGFFFGTVNEDAEFSSARLLGVDRFWGVRKGGCHHTVVAILRDDEKSFFARKQCFRRV
jgi:hypothetical protein